MSRLTSIIPSNLLYQIGAILIHMQSSHRNVNFGCGYGENGFQCKIDNSHPLDPLSAPEINSTSAITTAYIKSSTLIENFKFLYICLKEPEKNLLLPYFLNDATPPAGSVPRKAFVIVLSDPANRVYEVVVNLDQGKVESIEQIREGVTPIYTQEEVRLAQQIIQEDPNVQERSRRLGWTDMSLVVANTWPMGYIDNVPEFRGKRLCQMYIYGRTVEGDNQYPHPFDFTAVVDLLAKKVIQIQDVPTKEAFEPDGTETPVPRKTANYDPAFHRSSYYRRDMHPVQLSQDAPSYNVSGNEIRWQKFKMRMGFNAREGMILYQVNYNDSGRVRPLFYRMSLAEVFTAYGDPRSPYNRKVVSDESELGLGFHTNSLQTQKDCLGKVYLFDAVLFSDDGNAKNVPRVVCMYEEDEGILWKHSDYRTGKTVLVRSQRLSIMQIATVGNYDYVFTWRFYTDGKIEYNIKLTGIPSLNLLAVNASTIGHGRIVSPQINAQYHQHFFSLRIDPEIDGNQNSVSIVDVVQNRDDQNPYGQAFTIWKKPLKTAADGRTNVNVPKSRTWWITNPNEKHPLLQEPVSWQLTPHASPQVMIQKDSPYHVRSSWLDYNTWVLPYKENQLFPGGYYLNNSGLTAWVEQDPGASIENADIVLWHNFGVSHTPRVEDFPVMPAEQITIVLKPWNFFGESPALDVPGPK